MHPLRLQYELFSNANPMMAPLAAMAEQVRNNRKPAAEDNPFIAIQENASRQIVAAFDAWRDFNETLAERMFLAVYGSPALQAAAGIDPSTTRSHCGRRPRIRCIKNSCRTALPSSSREFRSEVYGKPWFGRCSMLA